MGETTPTPQAVPTVVGLGTGAIITAVLSGVFQNTLHLPTEIAVGLAGATASFFTSIWHKVAQRIHWEKGN